jgi:peptide chain release factor 2
MSAPDFWTNAEKAKGTITELKTVKGIVAPFDTLTRDVEESALLLDMALDAKDEATIREVEAKTQSLRTDLDRYELRTMFKRPEDLLNAYLTLHPGAGGTEACDWAAILLRLYMRWAERQGFSHEIIDVLPADEAGVKSATLHVKGEYAFGYLKAEAGVHRLVRISPFDAAKRRQTSFASVDVTPEFEEEPDIVIPISEVRRDTYRSGGAGGQYVNKTESAVRLTHIPTGIVVAVQNERSQGKNNALAWKLLKAKLYKRRLDEKEREAQKVYGAKMEVAFGSQIRSYVLQPYQLVKDHRTGFHTSQTDDVLDGDIDGFIEAKLRGKTIDKKAAEEDLP